MSDDGVQDIFNLHAISQPNIAYHSSCNLDEGSSTIDVITQQDLQDVLNLQPDIEYRRLRRKKKF